MFYMHSSILGSLPWQNLLLGQVNIFLRYDNLKNWVEIAIEQKWHWRTFCSNSRDEGEKLCQLPSFSGAEDWTQALALARQVLYHRAKAPIPEDRNCAHAVEYKMSMPRNFLCLRFSLFFFLLIPLSLQHPNKCCLSRWMLSSTVDSTSLCARSLNSHFV